MFKLHDFLQLCILNESFGVDYNTNNEYLILSIVKRIIINNSMFFSYIILLRDLSSKQFSDKSILEYILKKIDYLQSIKENIFLSSKYPVQSSLWKLTEQIMKLPSIQVDYFSIAFSFLKDNIDKITNESNTIIINIKQLLENIKHPSHYLYGQSPPYDLKIINNIKDNWFNILSDINQSTGLLNSYSIYVECIYLTYKFYIQRFESSSSQQKQYLCIPKASLCGISFNYFYIDNNVALELLCINEYGLKYKNNLLGTHSICKKKGVYYKPNPEGRFFIGPQLEFAVYAFYKILGGNGIAQSTLLKIYDVFLKDSLIPYGKPLQAGLGIDGILLQDLLIMYELILFLDFHASKNINNITTLQLFNDLLTEQYYNDFIHNNKHLNENSLKLLDIETCADIIIKEFENIYTHIKEEDRCIEFKEIPTPLATKRDILLNISNYGYQGLIKSLAFLSKYPFLGVYNNSQISFTKLCDFCTITTNIKSIFKKLTIDKIITEIRCLLDKFDSLDYSIHVIVSILTNPFDHKSDNFMVSISKHLDGTIEKLYLVGIDNDLAFSPTESIVRSMVYILPPMNNNIHSNIVDLLLKDSPEVLLFKWLTALGQQNIFYENWIKNGILTTKDLYEETGEKCLRIPFKIEEKVYFDIYNKLSQICNILKDNPNITHQDLFLEVQPCLAKSYKESLQSYTMFNEIYRDIYCSNKEEKIFPKIKILPKEAALKLLQTFNIHNISIEQQAILFGLIEETFSSLQLSLPINSESSDEQRVNFFFLAIKYGYCSLVAKILEEERTFSLNNTGIIELVHARNNKDRTALLEACTNLDIDMIKLLSYYGADLLVVDFDGKSAILHCLEASYMYINNIIDIIKFLGEQEKLLWNNCDCSRGWGPLHTIVMKSKKTDNTEELIHYLISKGTSPDLVDNTGKTPLDLAIITNKGKIVEQLINLGAGMTLNIPIAKKYFAKYKNLENTYNILKNQSLLLRWNICIENLYKLSLDENKRNNDTPTLESGKFGKLYIPDYLIKELFDDNGNIISTIKYGRRKVTKIQINEDDLYIKQYPEMPGIEYAVDKLFELLIGHGTSFTDLAKVYIPNKKLSYPILLSQGIKGETLHDIANSPSSFRIFESNLDALSFSEIFLVSMLVNFEDGKPDNYIVEKLSTGKYRIIGIDNDHAFVPAFSKKNGKLLVKCFLYCLNVMKEPIHPCAREKFLSIHPDNLLQIWLNDLQKQRDLYLKLFNKKEQKKLSSSKGSKPSIFIDIPFLKGTIVNIFQKFQRLQCTLKDYPKLPAIDILRIVSPQIGIIYSNAFFSLPSPIARFHKISEGQYSLDSLGKLETLSTSVQILQSMNISNKVITGNNNKIGPRIALNELYQIQQEINTSNNNRKLISKELLKGNISKFNELLLDTEKEKIINGISGILEPLDFDKILDNNQDDNNQKVLSSIIQGNYQKLRIISCKLLDKSCLTLISKNSPQLLVLELNNCNLILQDSLNILQEMKYLRKLTLTKLIIKDSIKIEHVSLKKLTISNCNNINKIIIPPSIEVLIITYCHNFTNIIVENPNGSVKRKKLFLKKKEYESVDNITLKRLKLCMCPKFKPWCNIFYDYLLENTENIINLVNIHLYPSKEESLRQFVISICKLNSSIINSMLKSLFKYYNLQIDELLPLLYLWINDIQKDPLFLLEQSIPKQFNSLSILNLQNYAKFITDEHIQLLRNNHSLTHLNLKYCNILSDNCLSVLSNCSLITKLNLYNCYNITNKGFKILFTNNSKLTDLDLSFCKINNDTINILVNNCSNLSTLKLYYCKDISNQSLELLANNCFHLQSLSICFCTKITTKGLLTIIKHCKVLKILDISYINNISLLEIGKYISVNKLNIQIITKELSSDEYSHLTNYFDKQIIELFHISNDYELTIN